MRFMITNEVSRIGIASTISGATTATAAVLFITPLTDDPRDDEAQQHRPGVAHEDLGRVEVEDQEGHARAGEGGGHDRRVGPAERGRQDGEGGGAEPGDAGGQAVHAVAEVDHVHDRDEPEDRQRVLGRAQVAHAHERQRDVVDGQPRRDRDRGAGHLARELDRRARGPRCRRPRRGRRSGPRRPPARAPPGRRAGSRAPAPGSPRGSRDRPGAAWARGGCAGPRAGRRRPTARARRAASGVAASTTSAAMMALSVGMRVVVTGVGPEGHWGDSRWGGRSPSTRAAADGSGRPS